MANIKSQIKRNRQNEKRRLRNRDFRGAARTAIKGANVSLESKQDAQASVISAISALDKAAQKGAIHPRNASRRKGRLMKHLAALGLQAVETKPLAAEPAASVNTKTKEPKSAKVEKESKPKQKTASKTSIKQGSVKTAAKKTTMKK